MTPDVLIVGAGPAGSIAATTLARAGARVRLVDRARFPRHKLCGDTLNPGTLALLGRIVPREPIDRRGVRLDGMIVTGEGVAVAGAYGPDLHGRSLARLDLDLWLLEQAAAAGADVDEGVVVRAPIVGADGRISGVLADANGSPRRLEARVTIAADGRRSTLAFALGLVCHPDRPRRWAAGAYFEGVQELSAFGEMHVRRGHYIGVAPLPGGIANVCLVTGDRARFGEPERSIESAVMADARLRGRFGDARRISAPTVLGPLAVDARAAGAPGLLLAGDAAGFVDPMTGDGLRFAVRGGELAARAALRALEGDAAAHERLARWRTREFSAKWRFNRTLRWLVGSTGALRIAGQASTVAPGLLRRMIANAGDVDLVDDPSIVNRQSTIVNRQSR